MIIDGKSIAEKIKINLSEEVKALPFQVGLAVVLVGNDGGSTVYVANKVKTCEQLGIKSFSYHFETSVSTKELIQFISVLNNDNNIHGILVQLPLPKTVDEQAVLSIIKPEKDVDGFHCQNVGKLLTGGDCLRPCTPRGIIELIKSTNQVICGKNAVVIGRSNIVGKPVAIMLLENDATVTITHSKTHDLHKIASNADILVVAIGKPNFVTKDFVKPGAIVIDVGTNRLEKLTGDVDFESVKEVAGYITPVPGGVGPMTIAMLMSNTVKAAKMQNGIK